MDVSENSGTPKSSFSMRFSIINHPFWGTPIFGNIRMFLEGFKYRISRGTCWMAQGCIPLPHLPVCSCIFGNQRSSWSLPDILANCLRGNSQQVPNFPNIWVFPRIGVPQMDGLYWKTLLKWMIWGYHYFRKHPYKGTGRWGCIIYIYPGTHPSPCPSNDTLPLGFWKSSRPHGVDFLRGIYVKTCFFSSWWCQPHWKMLVKMGSFPK